MYGSVRTATPCLHSTSNTAKFSGCQGGVLRTTRALRVKVVRANENLPLWYRDRIGEEFWVQDYSPMPDGIDLKVIHEGICSDERKLWLRSDNVEILREAVVNVLTIQTIEEVR